ncbi:hypothetical protein [Bordetella sp. 2513F-2]
MTVLSALLYFLSHHPFLSMLLLALAALAVGAAIARRRRNAAWCALGVAGLVLGMVNMFAGSMANALFLNAFGTYGTAVITHAEETSSQLNERNIWAYDAVMKTADGRDVEIHFDTLSASLYPVRNRIDIPPVGERFVIKYVPGFERNVAIMRDESPFGRRLLVAQARAPVERAAARLAASPDNDVFRQEYRAALRAFLERHGSDAEPGVVERYREALQALAPHGAR